MKRGAAAAFFLGGVAVLGLAHTTTGQQVFPSGVELVAVDVTAVDKEGRPATDLTVDDFTVTVGRRTRRIVSAQLLRLAELPAAAQPSTPAAAGPNAPAAAAPPSAAGGRLILLVPDINSLSVAGGKGAALACRKFLGLLTPRDRVALVSVPAGPSVDFTTDHARVAEMLGKVVGGKTRISGMQNVSLAEAVSRFAPAGDRRLFRRAFERQCSLCRTDTECRACEGMVTSEARRVYDDARADTALTVAALRRVLEALAGIDAPKTVVFLSQGMVTGASGGELSGNLQLRDVGDAAARARATVYTIQVDRTFLEAMDASVQGFPETPTEDAWLMRDGLEALAGYAGGVLLSTVTTPEVALERVARETSATWLLSFEPEENDRDGKPHDIRVQLRRKGLDLRSRPQFAVNAHANAAAAAGTPEERVGRALQAAVPATGLPMAMAAYALAEGDGSGVQLLVAIEVGLDPAAAAASAVGFRVVDETGAAQAGGGVQTGALEPLTSAPGVAYGSHSFVLKPGRYRVRAAVSDPGGRTGTVEQPVEARLHAGGGLGLSDVLLARASSRASGGPALQVDRRVGAEALRAYVEVQDDSAEPPSVQFEVVGASGELALVSGAPLRSSPEGRLTAETTLDFATLKPGSYLVRVLALRGGQEVGRVTRPIEVAAAPASR